MVKLNRRMKVLIIIVVFAATWWLCTQPLIKVGADKSYMQSQELSHMFDQKELYDFLIVWDQIQKGKLKKYLDKIPLQNEGEYPRQIVKWLELNNWSAERFFYDEQRLRDIINCVDLERSLSTNIEASEKASINLKELVANQKQRMKSCSFDKKEKKLIEYNRNQIVSIFVKR